MISGMDMDKRPHEDRAADGRAEIGRVRLKVTDLDRAMAFYRVLGFDMTQQLGNGTALLSTGGSHPQIGLNAAGLQDQPTETSSPCQFAIRLPDRAALAHALRRLTAAGIPLLAAVDDGVSEALYVRDPDGHRIELYYDRRAEEWPRDAAGALTIASQPIDLRALRATAEGNVNAAQSLQDAPAMSETTRNRLRDMRVRLLNLHKALLEDARTAYEMDRGRIGSNANLLQLVINDPWFAWLHPLSELVVRIDETLRTDAPSTDSDGAVLLEQVERLLSPAQSAKAFAQRYYDALQRQPAVIVAHAEVRRILKQAK